MFAPIDDICYEIRDRLSATTDIDYITLAGSGEPTLYEGIGELIAKVKGITNIPVAVLTNGSLLFHAAIRTELAHADLVIPSLDAGDELMFEYINRPHPDISFRRMIQGLIDFVRDFSGETWLEVFLLACISDLEAEVRKIAYLAEQISPHKIQINTLHRPGTEDFAYAVSRSKQEECSLLFRGIVEVIDDRREYNKPITGAENGEEEILGLITRRPCTLTDICTGLRLPIHVAAKGLEKLVKGGWVVPLRTPRGVFYRCLGKRP